MTPSFIYKVSFSLRKLYKLVSVKTKQCSRCLTSHLNRIYNGHAQKCRYLYNHSPTNIEAGEIQIPRHHRLASDTPFTTTQLLIITQYTPMKHLKISCQKHKMYSLLLSSRYMTNYMKTNSFLHAHFTETMKIVCFKKLMVISSFIEKPCCRNTLKVPL